MWEFSLVTKMHRAVPRRPAMCNCEEGPMAQLVVSWLVSDGSFRVHAINAVGRRKGRILEVEEVDSVERVHGSPRRLERLVQRLRQSSGELDQVPAWTPDTTS